MIRLINLQKSFWTPGGRKVVARNINAIFPTGVSVGLLGRNGAGKSTLMQMIGGTIRPDGGEIEMTGTISWPVGFAGSFHRDMTGAQNVRFIARVYGIDSQSLLDFVEDFAELGSHFHLPVRQYSSGMRSRLAFGVSIGIPFDTYLVDEVTSVGDANFKARSAAIFQQRMRHASAIVVSHSPKQMRDLCQAGAVLENGELTYYNNINAAITHHHRNMGIAPDDDDDS